MNELDSFELTDEISDRYAMLEGSLEEYLGERSVLTDVRHAFPSHKTSYSKRTKAEAVRVWMRYYGVSHEEASSKVAEQRKRQARSLRDYRKWRVPRPFERAERIAFNHCPMRSKRFRSVIARSHKLFLESLPDSAGRDGAIPMLEIVAQLIARIPMADSDRARLVEVVQHIKRGLEIVEDGGTFRAFAVQQKRGGRSHKLSLRMQLRASFEHRCVLAFDTLKSFGTSSQRDNAASIVYERALPAARSLNILQATDRPNRGQATAVSKPFSEATIVGWHRRSTTALNKMAGGNYVDEYADLRDRYELHKGILLRHFGEDERVQVHMEVEGRVFVYNKNTLIDLYLNSLEEGNLYRSVESLMPTYPPGIGRID